MTEDKSSIYLTLLLTKKEEKITRNTSIKVSMEATL